MTEDCGPIESFFPLYTYKYTGNFDEYFECLLTPIRITTRFGQLKYEKAYRFDPVLCALGDATRFFEVSSDKTLKVETNVVL